MKALGLHFLPLIIVASIATNVFASCPGTFQGPPCVEYWRTDAVFIGMVDRVVRVPNTTGLAIGPYVRSTVHFTIEEAFKGVGGTALVMELEHCGYVFNEGQRYLVYANRNPNTRELDVQISRTRTRLVSEAAADLQYIRGLSSSESGSRVFGTVTQYPQSMADKRPAEALQKIKMTLDGNNQHYEVFTDSQGRFEFNRLAAGTYRLSAELPSYLKHDAETFKLNGRDCQPVAVWALPNGQIVGTVVDENGKPLQSVPISIVSAALDVEEMFGAGNRKVKWPFTETDRHGRFRFSNLTPGRYLLVVNASESETLRGRLRALPRLFYPGVNDHRGATVITVGDFADSREYEFRLPVP